MSKYPPSFAPFMSESPLFPTLGSGNLYILNVRTAHGCELHYHNPLDGMSEICQNPLGCPWGPLWELTLTGVLLCNAMQNGCVPLGYNPMMSQVNWTKSYKVIYIGWLRLRTIYNPVIHRSAKGGIKPFVFLQVQAQVGRHILFNYYQPDNHFCCFVLILICISHLNVQV